MTNLQRQPVWKTLLTSILLFLPVSAYLLASLGYLSVAILPVLMPISALSVMGWGLWKLRQGITRKDGHELSGGLIPLVLGCLGVFQSIGLVTSDLMLPILLFAVGGSWLTEKWLVKTWG